MIQNLTDLARECGSSINGPSDQRSAIAKAVLSHSEGSVRTGVHLDLEGLALITAYGRMVMRFPFEGDTFWKNIEWLHEESLDEQHELDI
jgi:hypothetical protein